MVYIVSLAPSIYPPRRKSPRLLPPISIAFRLNALAISHVHAKSRVAKDGRYYRFPFESIYYQHFTYYSSLNTALSFPSLLIPIPFLLQCPLLRLQALPDRSTHPKGASLSLPRSADPMPISVKLQKTSSADETMVKKPRQYFPTRAI